MDRIEKYKKFSNRNVMEDTMVTFFKVRGDLRSILVSVNSLVEDYKYLLETLAQVENLLGSEIDKESILNHIHNRKDHKKITLETNDD